MPQESYANPVMNDGSEFHSDIPISELTERVTRAIMASDVSSAPLIVETMDGVMHRTRPTPTEPKGLRGSGCPTSTREINLLRRSQAGQTQANTPNGRNIGVGGPRKEYQDT